MTKSVFQKIDEMADRIADEALSADKSAEDRQDAFKLLFPYYALLMKHRVKDDGDSETLTFDEMARSFNGGPRAALSGRGGRGGASPFEPAEDEPAEDEPAEDEPAG